MSERRGRGKRLIPIPESLIREIMEASSKEGKTLNGYIEEALLQAVKVSSRNQNLENIIRSFDILQSQKASGAIFTPLTVFDFMTKNVYAKNKEALQSEWFESGKWFGKYLKEKFADPVQALADLLNTVRWDLNEVNINETDGNYKLRCTSIALNKQGTKLLLRFIEGALDAIECKIVKSEFMKGLVLVEFSLCT